MKLSHSAIEKYKTCPRMYKLHYIDKIREITTHSPLVFGSAMDAALNLLLETKNLELAKKKLTDELDRLITDDTIIRYLKTDFEVRLLEPKDIDVLRNMHFDSLVLPAPFELAQFVSEALSLAELNQDERKLLNTLQRMSLAGRGILMLEAYEREVLPKIKDIKAIQKKIILKNEEGDELVGFVDFIADFDNQGTTIIDNKTAGRPYPDDAVQTSQQFGIYCEAEQIPRAAYVVMLKNVRFSNENLCIQCGHTETSRKRRCPTCGSDFVTEVKKSVDVQILHDIINDKHQEALFGAIDVVLNSIKNEQFDMNTSACDNQFGRRCPYYSFCHEGGKMTGLEVKIEEKK